MRACLERGFMATVMLMALKVHRSARVLLVPTQAGMCLSTPVLPQHSSIIAGCTWAVTFTRMHLYAILEDLQAQADQPVSGLTTWVDDIFMVAQGTNCQQVANIAVGIAARFMGSAKSIGLVISPKSTCITSSKQLKTAILENKKQILANPNGHFWEVPRH